jgi:Mg-chelatase subunit ChlD
MAILRGAAIIAAVLACVGLELPFPTRARTVVALIDVSESVGSEGIAASREAALELFRSLDRRDRAAVVAFAGKPAVLSSLQKPEKAASILESVNLEAPMRGSTDISTAIEAAKSVAREGRGSKAVYLFSDGRANAGSSPSSPPSKADSSRVAVYAIGEGKEASGIRAEALTPPNAVRSGERVILTWKLFSDSERAIDYALIVDGKVAERGRASLSAGRNEIPLAVNSGEAGRHSLAIEAEGASCAAYLDVSGPARAIIAHGDGARGDGARSDGAGRRPSALARALSTQGLEVSEGGPESLPEEGSGYESISAVVLDDMPALAMTETQQACLQDYVASGGGLLVIGGESSLGRGDYYATPLEDMLPVQTDSRRRLQFTRAKLLFVIDHSGSMSETVGSVSKQMAAMKGVAAAIDELDSLDEVGIIGFDSTPSWVIPFTPASQKRKILDALSTLGDGGGTDLEAAFEEILRGFGDPGPTKRHAIILSDGLTPEADFRGLASRLKAAGASASTIAIGDEANEELLKNLAAWCGGAYYRADADKIPAIIDKETIRMTRELIQEGRIETRARAHNAPVGALTARNGLKRPLSQAAYDASDSLNAPSLVEGTPPLDGYLITKAKDSATVSLEARSSGAPSGEAWDPLLATWRYGNGKVAVFTSDSGKRWLSSWSGLSAYNRLWGEVLRSVERAESDGSLRTRASAEAGGATVVVEARGKDRRSLSGLRLSGKVQGPFGSAFSLKETAPGRYEGFAPLEGQGLFGIEVYDAASSSRGSAWAWKSPGEASSAGGADNAALSLIASSGGGELLQGDAPKAAPAKLGWDRVDLRLLLIILATLLLVADLYLRSTMAGQMDRARKALAAYWAKELSMAAASREARNPWPSRDAISDAEKEARFLEMQRKLAEHGSRRYKDKDGAIDA